jgi:hypothetical protein
MKLGTGEALVIYQTHARIEEWDRDLKGLLLIEKSRV